MGASWVGWISGTLAEVAFDLGELAEAESILIETLDVAGDAGDEALLRKLYSGLALVTLYRGRVDEAAAHLARGAEFLEDAPELRDRLDEAWVHARLAWAAGDVPAALGHLGAAAELAERHATTQDPEAHLDRARLLAIAPDRRQIDEVLTALGANSTPAGVASLRAAEGVLSDDPATAVSSLRDAAARLQALGSRVFRGQVLLDLGRAQRTAGEDPRAAFGEARDLFRACDAQLFLPEVEAELRKTPPAVG
jgi:tetratricopeptide (TPR) repeat protein